MLILAFDTTSAACSVALWRDGAVLQRAQSVMEYGQAEALMPMIETVMAQADVAYAALDRIAVTVGPGSFTGVRIGLAAARGIAMAADKPVVGVTSMEVLAHAVPDDEMADADGIVVAIDTKRGDYFLQKFTPARAAVSDITPLTPADVYAWAGAGAWIVVGDSAIAEVMKARLSIVGTMPDVSILARLATSRTPQAGGPLPLYVHAPSVTMPS